MPRVAQNRHTHRIQTAPVCKLTGSYQQHSTSCLQDSHDGYVCIHIYVRTTATLLSRDGAETPSPLVHNRGIHLNWPLLLVNSQLPLLATARPDAMAGKSGW